MTTSNIGTRNVNSFNINTRVNNSPLIVEEVSNHSPKVYVDMQNKSSSRKQS